MVGAQASRADQMTRSLLLETTQVGIELISIYNLRPNLDSPEGFDSLVVACNSSKSSPRSGESGVFPTFFCDSYVDAKYLDAHLWFSHLVCLVTSYGGNLTYVGKNVRTSPDKDT